jgi:hypothetical protein
MGISWEHIEKYKKNPTPPPSQENNMGPLDACYLTSLATRNCFLAYLYSFPFLALDIWQEDEPWVYVCLTSLGKMRTSLLSLHKDLPKKFLVYIGNNL